MKSLTQQEATAARLPEGCAFRLPTEAEWEFVASAGTEVTVWSEAGFDVSDYAWLESNSFLVTHPVAELRANGWGFHDMYGNVSEWCADWFAPFPATVLMNPSGPPTGTLRTVRGGHITLDAPQQSSVWRSSTTPTTRSPVLGFRIVLAPPIHR